MKIKSLTQAIMRLPAAGIIITVALSGRDLSFAALYIDALGEKSPFSQLISQLFYYGSIVLCAFAFCIALARYSLPTTKARRLEIALICYAMIAPALAALMGSGKGWQFSWFIAPLMLITLGRLSVLNPQKSLFILKSALLLIICAGYVLSLAAPSMALEPWPLTFLPGIDFRYWGATPHANTAGALGALALLLECGLPARSMAIRILNITLCSATLILSQSKTSILACVASMALMMWLQIGIRTNVNLKKKMLKRVLMLTALLLIGVVVVVQFQALSDAASQKEFGGGNFSGRDQIWAQAIKEWSANPLFGYGPTIWSEEYREQVDMNYAFHAHSQLFQTLGESGIVGLCSLLFFLQVVIGCYRQRLTREKILTFTVLTFLLIRSITEPSFRTLVAFGGDTMFVAIIYVSTLICLTQGWSRSPQKGIACVTAHKYP